MEDAFELTPAGPFSLEAAARFGRAFVPSPAGGVGDVIRLAFAVERAGWQTAGVEIRAHESGLRGRVVGPDGARPDAALAEAAAQQACRILSLDVDGRGFPAVGERDPVAGALQARFPGLRPVLFASPYEAAAWGILGQRIRLAQAANVRRRLAEELGDTVAVGHERLAAFPAPARLAALEARPRGLTPRKAEQLRTLAHVALEGRLDAARLRALPEEEALRDLMRLPGIGPFGAELTLIRGAGAPDRFPESEPRAQLAMRRAYGLGEDAPTEELRRIADRWRPYRSWMALLLRVDAERDAPVTPGAPGAAPRPGR